MIRATITLTQPLSDRRQFVVRTGGGHHFLMDDRNGASGPTPVELAAAALGGSTASRVISALREVGIYVTDYEVRVEAQPSSPGPAAFAEVRIHHVLTGIDVQPDAVADAIRLAEKQPCGIYATLAATMHRRTTFEIREAEVEDDPRRVIHGEVQ